ncbi:excisionase family DNA binding protein [Azospirillum agricola]|uniref:helix-turn-helix domain-containing protein n=1 Tax=Azospirillum agricola TaxID=1720247 RepID=UPI001AE63AA6|nr:helix-turn-helix domain-containing protein [Azospirillum agricola]MBP2229695.1 excisionase family DNA binding protein [Azospirillum agricola]
MLVEFVQEIDDHDIAKARRGVDELRTLIGKAPIKEGEVTVQMGTGFVTLDISALRSMAELVSIVSTHSRTAEGDEEISPQDAAELLRMSRPSVMRLIEKGLLKARKVGAHHRLLRAEVLSYKQNQASIRRNGLTEVAKISEEYDF